MTEPTQTPDTTPGAAAQPLVMTAEPFTQKDTGMIAQAPQGTSEEQMRAILTQVHVMTIQKLEPKMRERVLLALGRPAAEAPHAPLTLADLVAVLYDDKEELFWGDGKPPTTPLNVQICERRTFGPGIGEHTVNDVAIYAPLGAALAKEPRPGELHVAVFAMGSATCTTVRWQKKAEGGPTLPE